MYKKRIQAQHVWYNPVSGKSFDIKTPGCFTFDSKSEFRCYMLLRELFPGYIIQSQVELLVLGGKTWKCDFCVAAVNRPQAENLRLVVNRTNAVNITSPLSRIFVEYKGTIDKNFHDKLKLIHNNDSELFDEIIILSDVPSGIVFENLTTLERSVKCMSSTKYFERIVKCLKL